MLAQNGLERLVDERGLARAAHSRDHDELAERKLHVHVFQVVSARSPYPQTVPVALAAVQRCLYPQRVVEVSGCDGVVSEHLLRRALKHHLASFAPRFRTDVHNVVGAEHHVLVVFHHDDGVAHVAQALQRVYQTLVVALMQTYAWLVEDVENVDELRAYLRGEPYALALSSGERRRLAVERQIVEPHVEQEVYSRTYFLQNLRRYFLLRALHVCLCLTEPFAQLAHVHGREFGYVLVPDAV